MHLLNFIAIVILTNNIKLQRMQSDCGCSHGAGNNAPWLVTNFQSVLH